jgi:hypothetical protein
MAAAGAAFADELVILGGLLDQRLLWFGDRGGGDADGAAGVEDVQHRALVGRVDLERGVDLAGRRRRRSAAAW